MITFHWKETLDIKKIKEADHCEGSEINFYDKLGRRISLLSIFLVLVYAILLVKLRRCAGEFEASLISMILGLICSILMFPIHELLHAICIPKSNDVHIYKVKSGFMTWFNKPITKRRYLAVLLVPVLLLGFVPSIGVFFIPETAPACITFLLLFSLGNIGGACSDLTNFIMAAVKVKKGNKILPCKNGIFQIQQNGA